MIKSEPWVAYFKQSVGQPLTFSPTNKPVIIDSKGNKSAGTAQSSNLPIDVISPLEQTNRMAIAQMKKDKDDGVLTPKSLSVRRPSKKEGVKKTGRGYTASKTNSKKKKKNHLNPTSTSTSTSTPNSLSTKKSKSLKSKTPKSSGNKVVTSLGPQKQAKHLTFTGARAKDIFSKVKD